MRRVVLALLLALPVVALATAAYAECGGTHSASSDQIAQPAPPPPPTQPRG